MVAGVGDEPVQPLDETRHQARPHDLRPRGSLRGRRIGGQRLELALERQVDRVADRAGDDLPVDVPDRTAVEPSSERDRRQGRQRRQRRIGNHLGRDDTASARSGRQGVPRTPRSPGGKPIESRTAAYSVVCRPSRRRTTSGGSTTGNPSLPRGRSAGRSSAREAAKRATRGRSPSRKTTSRRFRRTRPSRASASSRFRLSRDRPDEGEEAARGEIPTGGGGVGVDRSAQRDPGRHGLRVARLGRRPRLEVGGRAENEVERSLSRERGRVAEVPLEDPESPGETVEGDAAPRERRRERLRLDRDDVRPRQLPRRGHRDRADAGAEVEEPLDARRREDAPPGDEEVVGGVAVAAGGLEDPEAPAEEVERLAVSRARRRRAAAARDAASHGRRRRPIAIRPSRRA